MKKVVVTGANGFLGKNLVAYLADFGVSSVKLLDISPIQLDSDFRVKHTQHLLDLSDKSLIDYIDEGDVVIHLAWRSNPSVTGADINTEMELNWNASRNVIDVCSAKKAKLLFISSGGTVYGKPEYLPIDEIHPKNPISAYGAVKLKVEEAIVEANKKDGLRYVILRPSNLFGPGFSLEKGLGVIGHWVAMIKKDLPIKMVGKGELVRDFVHVDDLCRGILSCLELQNETLNLGSGKGTSLNELSAIFEHLIGKPLKIEHMESRGFDVQANVLSIEKIERLTNWSPNTTLEQGILQLL